MNRNYFLWIVGLALGSLLLIFFVFLQEVNSPLTEAPVPPTHSPYSSYIAGVGVVEASSGNISIATPLNRLVEKVMVKENSHVKKGEVLFTLEESDLLASLNAQKAAFETAMARLNKLQSMPQPEEAAAAQAAVRSAQVELESAKQQYNMVQGLSDPRSISQEEKNRRLFQLQQAEARYIQAQADWSKVSAGAWEPDVEIAKLEVEQAKASVQGTQAQLQNTKVRSPIDGTVLKVNIHPGEVPTMPSMIIGKTKPLYLRVSINQLDIPRFNKNAPAVGYLEGDSNIPYPLEFVNIEPFLATKQNLTNEITEKVDTRVLNIIYCIKDSPTPLIIGQQMDVFIETNEGQKQ